MIKNDKYIEELKLAYPFIRWDFNKRFIGADGVNKNILIVLIGDTYHCNREDGKSELAGCGQTPLEAVRDHLSNVLIHIKALVKSYHYWM